jgi:hypothetical protein
LDGATVIHSIDRHLHKASCVSAILPGVSFVVDPDGHRIEAVCHAPEKAMIV